MLENHWKLHSLDEARSKLGLKRQQSFNSLSNEYNDGTRR